MTGQDLVDQLKQLGFDNTDDEILEWANERQKEMVAVARSRRQLVSIGPTVVDQPDYDVPATIVHLFEVAVSGAPYGGTIHTDLALADQSDLVWLGNGLWAVGENEDDGTKKIRLIPAPSEAGQTIVLYAAVRAPELTLAGQVYIDDEFVRYLRYGAMATGWDLNAEDGNTSERYEARFEAGVERYRRWVARRFRGSGPAQIRVKGLNA